MKSVKRVVIITDSDFSWLPLEANLAVVLSRKGYLVDILHRRNEKQAIELEFELPESVKLHAIGDIRKIGGKIGVAWSMLWFLLRSLLFTAVRQPAVIVGWNWWGFTISYLCHFVCRSPIVVYHSQEYYSLEETPRSPLKAFELRYAKRADIVSCPEENRGRLMREELGLSEMPLTVINTRLFSPTTHSDHLQAAVSQKGVKASRIVVHSGAMVEYYFVEELVRSVLHWPEDTALALIGTGEQHYVARILGLIGELGLQDRVAYLGKVSQVENLALISGGAAGVVFSGSVNWNRRFAAPNKLGDYLWAGLPIIGSPNPLIRQVINEGDCGICVDPSQPDNIAAAVSFVFSDPERYNRMRSNARALFEHKYHYEYQSRTLVQRVAELRPAQ